MFFSISKLKKFNYGKIRGVSSSSFSSSSSPLPPPSSPSLPPPTLLYSSSPPLVVLNAARAFCAQGLVSFALSIKLGEKAVRARGFEYDASRSGLEALEALKVALFETSVNPALPPHAQGSIALLIVGICCITFARGIVERTVLRIERLDAPKGSIGEEESLRITRMSLFPSSGSLGAVALYKRSDVRGAESHRVTTMFRVKQQGWIGSEMDQYLFPVEGEGGRVGAKGAWVSEDIKYLQKLIYSDYFRPTEKSPVFDRTLIDVQGFGPFRPAKLADPNNPAFAIGEALALKKLASADAARLHGHVSKENNGNSSSGSGDGEIKTPGPSSSPSEESMSHRGGSNYVLLERQELVDALINAGQKTSSTTTTLLKREEEKDLPLKQTADSESSPNDAYIVDRNGNLYSQFVEAPTPTIDDLRKSEMNREMIKGAKANLTIEEQKEIALPKKFVSSSR